MKSIIKVTGLFLLTVFFVQCQNNSGDFSHRSATVAIDGYSIELYAPDISSSVLMDLAFNDGDDHIYAFGNNNSAGNNVDAFSLFQQDESYVTNMLLGAKEGVSYFYSIDKTTSQPDNVLLSVDIIDGTKAYVNIFEYDWAGQKGNLLYKILVDTKKYGSGRFELILDYSKKKKNGDSIEIVDTENNDSDSATADSTDSSEDKDKKVSITQLRSRMTSTLNYFISQKYHPVFGTLTELHVWLKRTKREVIYNKTIEKLASGTMVLTETVYEYYSESTVKIDAIIAENKSYIPTNFPVQYLFNADIQDDLSKYKIIQGLETIRTEYVVNIVEANIDQPSKCNAVTKSGGYGTTTTEHFLGIESGLVTIDYEMYGIPDQMDVFYDGAKVASTNGNVSGTGTLSFAFDGTPPYSYTITVVGDNTGTAWDYVGNCPQQGR